MNPIESSGSVKSTPKVAATCKAPEIAQIKVQEAQVIKTAKEAKSVNPNDKKYRMYGSYERGSTEQKAEQDLKQFRSTMATYLTRSQALIESGDANGAVDHIENLMSGFSFSENNKVVVEMYRLLNYVSNNIKLNGLDNDGRRQSLGGIVRNLAEGFMD